MKPERKPFSAISLVPILAALFVVIGLITLAYVLFQFALPGAPVRQVSTPVITIIPAPAATALVAPTLPGALTATPTRVAPGMMGIGAYVQISGTGGDGLRLRSGPGKGNAPLFLGGESEAFLVKDGPKEADGFTWWFLVAPYDEQRKGWAVENYLSVVTSQPEASPQPTR
jgi:hypothetical protein